MRRMGMSILTKCCLYTFDQKGGNNDISVVRLPLTETLQEHTVWQIVKRKMEEYVDLPERIPSEYN